MTTLLQHAKSELRTAGLFDNDSEIGVQVTALMETFCVYSGTEETIDVFKQLARHLPLLPLTGEDEEWEVPEGACGQLQVNKRCTQVFRDDEMAWDVRKGRTPITFPYLA